MAEIGVKDHRRNQARLAGTSHELPTGHKATRDPRWHRNPPPSAVYIAPATDDPQGATVTPDEPTPAAAPAAPKAKANPRKGSPR